jgi:hypothetical protein
LLQGHYSPPFPYSILPDIFLFIAAGNQAGRLPPEWARVGKNYRAVHIPKACRTVPINIDNLVEYIVLRVTKHGRNGPGIEISHRVTAFGQREAGEVRHDIVTEPADSLLDRSGIPGNGPVHTMTVIIMFQEPD